jgi:hypothetical protein
MNKPASSKKVSRRRPRLTEEEIDQRVIAEAGDDSAWEAPVQVSRKSPTIGLPTSLAQRAAFLARLHRERNLQTWIERVVRERVELEERAFTQARRELSAKPDAST